MQSRNIAAAAAAALTVAAITALGAAPAQAAPFGGSVKHTSPDNGYDAALTVECDDRIRFIAEGQHSDDRCNDEDVDRFFVRPGEEWWSVGINGVPFKAYDKTGWVDCPGFSNGSYTVRED